MPSPLDLLRDALADHYRVERELGAGGMATVYLAHDLKHDRDVAIKVLRPELAAVIGADRFLAEIKTTANLQHPHILSLFDSGTVAGTVFYVMPLVEGESLRERLTREKQLPVSDAIRIASEVADALEYAHRHGVIHRDIKPENILLQGGHAQVADFGIALAASKTGGARMTETGMSLGTPHYMSPEQAMGERELDARTDVYALGCVTYEMLAGEPPFTGPTAQSIVAKVMTESAPSARHVRATVPEHVDDAIQVALQKLPADRFRTAAEFGAALATASRAPLRVASPVLQRPTRSRIAALAGGAAAIATTAFVIGSRSPTVSGGTLPLTFGRSSHVTWDPALELTPVLSPDGRSVAYAAGSLLHLRVMVRPIGEGRAVPLTGDSTGTESNPQWSPDGSRVLFLARDGVFSAPSSGGPARPEVPGDARSPVTSATWSPDGALLAITRGDSLFIREKDATMRAVARLAEPALCSWSPQGTFLACATENGYYAAAGSLFGNLSPSRIVLCRVRDGALTTVTDSLWLNTSPAWSADGRWLYFVSNRDGPRDIYGLSLTSDGAARERPVRLSTGLGAHTISLAASGGRLAYSRFSVRTSIWSLPISGSLPVKTSGATRITNTNESIEVFTVSADARWLLYDSDLSGNSDIFRRPIAGGEAEQLTSDPADDFAPALSPDGKEVAFHSWRSGSRDIFVMRLDGGGVQQVTHSPRQEANADWSPDGRSLVYDNLAAGGGIWIVRRDASGRWGEPTLRRAGGFLPVWSPDGRWIAIRHALGGRGLTLIPSTPGPERILTDESSAGARPIEAAGWGDDGLIYYQTRDVRGRTVVWALAPTGGKPRQVVQFEPELNPSTRTMVIRRGRLYFYVQERESDIWAMEVRR